ncbi:hypothetical protein KKJ25_15735 [Xenorhabdus bovienii]|uniref:hypothetical protein n=2 Tax=Xenorhabdus bovienii TaxID=40576 RepID=UPI00237D2948|nr:hypothetical protein [Xenorhabdus bovienii]MDE1496340.1 hypothetical protein [Xenorhabdus bovienii]MDE9474338.1 hypothetical protein [Xenorhabdus bovienii]
MSFAVIQCVSGDIDILTVYTFIRLPGLLVIDVPGSQADIAATAHQSCRVIDMIFYISLKMVQCQYLSLYVQEFIRCKLEPMLTGNLAVLLIIQLSGGQRDPLFTV